MFLDTWRKTKRGDNCERSIKVVTRFTKNDPVILTPISNKVWDKIESVKGIVYTQHSEAGFKYIVTFPESDYSLCFLKTDLSTGHRDDTFEAVVLDICYTPCYDTDFGQDSIGYSNENDICSYIDNVSVFDRDGKSQNKQLPLWGRKRLL